jgi:hypothetical protein
MRVARHVLWAALLLAPACASNDPPLLESFEIWDGEPESTGAVTVQPTDDGHITLRFNKVYTGRARLRTAGRDDRCIYRVFGYNWNLPSRDFNCTPETGKRMIIDEPIATWRSDVARVERGPGPRLMINVMEYDLADRHQLSHFRPYDFSVSFVP